MLLSAISRQQPSDPFFNPWMELTLAQISHDGCLYPVDNCGIVSHVFNSKRWQLQQSAQACFP